MPRHSNPNYAVNPVQRRAKTPPDAKREREKDLVGWELGGESKGNLGQTGENKTRDKLQRKTKGGAKLCGEILLRFTADGVLYFAKA